VSELRLFVVFSIRHAGLSGDGRERRVYWNVFAESETPGFNSAEDVRPALDAGKVKPSI